MSWLMGRLMIFKHAYLSKYKSKNNEIATEDSQMSLQQIPIGISQIKDVGN